MYPTITPLDKTYARACAAKLWTNRWKKMQRKTHKLLHHQKAALSGAASCLLPSYTQQLAPSFHLARAHQGQRRFKGWYGWDASAGQPVKRLLRCICSTLRITHSQSKQQWSSSMWFHNWSRGCKCTIGCDLRWLSTDSMNGAICQPDTPCRV